jgi:hypothetical protein
MAQSRILWFLGFFHRSIWGDDPFAALDIDFGTLSNHWIGFSLHFHVLFPYLGRSTPADLRVICLNISLFWALTAHI